MNLKVYTDASHNDYHKISACGFVILSFGKIVSHEIVLVEGLTCSGQAEVYAAALALNKCCEFAGLRKINLFTDSYMVKDYINFKGLPPRVFHLIDESGELKEIKDTLHECKIKLYATKVPAHANDTINNIVDTSVRGYLRSQLSAKCHLIGK